ncbi:trichohyalin-like isoform X2 [Saccostrea echinata]|uniref:trichohyalin-like isoform X2 n=1 Tax=Saccostrea echinata TaxID=191078 RepID=UPI002A7F16A9|nr:trichohyalin-like isoform X2 [Saccostrea echinata]
MSSVQEEMRGFIPREIDKDYVRIVQRKYMEWYKTPLSASDMMTAIKYIYRILEGEESHRKATKLFGAIQHIEIMRKKGRLNPNGLPVDYSMEELQQILSERNGHPQENLDRIVKECEDKRGYRPSPEEFEDLFNTLKVKLEQEVAIKDMQIEEGNEELQRKNIQLHEKDQIIKDKDRMLEEKDRMLKDKDRMLKDKDRKLKDKDRMLEEKEREKIRLLEGKEKEIQMQSRMIKRIQECFGQMQLLLSRGLMLSEKEAN